MSDAETKAKTDAEVKAPARADAMSSVLVVDDEPLIRSALKRMLVRRGYEVIEAGSGVEALAVLDEREVGVVLTDIRMPEMDGIEMLRAVKQRDPDAPVVLLTGEPSLDSAIRAIELGAYRYLLKPIAVNALLPIVEQAIRLKRLSIAKREAHAILGAAPAPEDIAGLDACLTRALSALDVAFQPLVGVRTRSVTAYEALMRSREAALPHPGAVLDAAERLKRLPDVLRAVAERAARDVRQHGDDLLLFLNLHPHDINDDWILDDGCPLRAFSSRVVLELTERASLSGIADLKARIMRLRELGYRLAVDDLGAGYASLSAFVDLEPEFVKIDMGLVRGIDASEPRQRVVRTLTELCHEMGAVVVAEGVETRAERDQLVELGCDLLQGYYFARPGPPFPEAAWER